MLKRSSPTDSDRNANKKQKPSLDMISAGDDTLNHEMLDRQQTLLLNDTLRSGFNSEVMLLTIVEDSKDTMDQRYSQYCFSRDLIINNSGLEQLLQECWETKSFARIRRLAVLQKPKNFGDFFGEGQDSIEAQANGLGSTIYWKCSLVVSRYSGRHAKNEKTRPVPQHSRNLARLWNGKSRTVHEMASRVFTIPFNLRSTAEAADLAFPPADTGIRECLLQDVGKTSYANLQCRYLEFLVAIFTEVEGGVKILPIQTTIPDVASAWRDYMEANRNTLYPSSSQGQEQRGLLALQSKAKDSMGRMLQTLDNRVQTPSDSRPVKAVLYFDEAHCLVEARTAAGEGQRSAFDTFRIAQGPELQPPFTELPFDCSWDNSPIISEGQMGLADVISEEFLIKFGRPLWYTRYQHGDAAVKSGILRFAREKLTRLSGRRENRTLDNDAVLAVLSIRLLMDFEVRREAARLKEAKLVEGYMRVAFSVTAHREYFWSRTPSEPILADAAALEMGNWTGVDGVASKLSTHLQSGLISKEHRGELVARLLLVLAYDRAILRHYETKSATPAFLYSSGCPLEIFLTELFGEKGARTILDSKPDNVQDGATLKTAFANAWGRFTHFGRTGDDGGASAWFSWVAFTRGMAIQCAVGQKSIGLVIPVLLKNADKLGESRMTGILISVKDKMRLENPSLLKDIAALLYALRASITHLYMNVPLRDLESNPLGQPSSSLRHALGGLQNIQEFCATEGCFEWRDPPKRDTLKRLALATSPVSRKTLDTITRMKSSEIRIVHAAVNVDLDASLIDHLTFPFPSHWTQQGLELVIIIPNRHDA
ncbi:hypothetical protein FRB98_004366 [Tulasnella sp. 332]|nr:hypothetical protein FRB98_004366 [Tulasnella sp. 332]